MKHSPIVTPEREHREMSFSPDSEAHCIHSIHLARNEKDWVVFEGPSIEVAVVSKMGFTRYKPRDLTEADVTWITARLSCIQCRRGLTAAREEGS